jgi:hypothetical protein
MKRILSVVFCCLVTAATCTAQSTLYFPQIAEGVQTDGTQWGMIIAVTNPTTTVTAFELDVMKDDGTPWTISWQQDGCFQESGNQSSIICDLGPGHTALFISPGESGHSTTPLQTGSAKINQASTDPPVSGTAIFSEVGPAGRIAQAGVLSATASTRQEVIALAPNLSGANFLYPPNTATSAVAIANPGASTANITFQLLDFNGVAAAPPATKTLAASNHTAFFVNQLFPNTTIGGRLRILSDVPIVATALLFQNNGQFATFPVFPLP